MHSDLILCHKTPVIHKADNLDSTVGLREFKVSRGKENGSN